MINPYDFTVTRYVKVQTAVNLLVYLNSLEWWDIPYGESLKERLAGNVKELIEYLERENRAALSDVPSTTISKVKEKK